MEMSVRDYECDLQGIVNHAVYLNYLEHCRHRFLQSVGGDFVRLVGQGIDLVVTRAEVDYKKPLRAGDRFAVELDYARHGPVRIRFDQRIRLPEGEERQNTCLLAKIFVTGVNRKTGRIALPELVKTLPKWAVSPSG